MKLVFIVAAFLITAQPWLFMPQAEAQTAGAGIYIPMYFRSSSTVDRIEEAARAHPEIRFIVAINPASGPGFAPSSALMRAVEQLQDAGVTVIGYVPTGWTGRPLDLVRLDIQRYSLFYHANGIMFDEMSNRAGDSAYYRAASAFARSLGMSYTVGNPGTSVPDEYIGSVDNIHIYENHFAPSLSMLADRTPYAAHNYGIIPYHVSSMPPDEYVHAALAEASVIYITDEFTSQRWRRLPAYFDALVDSVSRYATGAPPLPPEEQPPFPEIPPVEPLPILPISNITRDHITVIQTPATDRYGHAEVNEDGTMYPSDSFILRWSVDTDSWRPVAEFDEFRVRADVRSEMIVEDEGTRRATITADDDYGEFETTLRIRVVGSTSGHEYADETFRYTSVVVPFNPVYSAYLYPVLNDGQRAIYDDRTGMIVRYDGSQQGTQVFEQRRAVWTDSYNSTALIEDYTHSQNSVPLPAPIGDESEFPLPDWPTGVEERVITPYEVRRQTWNPVLGEDDRHIFIPHAGYVKYYLGTAPIDDVTAVRYANITSTFLWPEQGYNGTFLYTMPDATQQYSNELRVTLLSDDDRDFTVQTVPGHVTKTGADEFFARASTYGMLKARWDTGDVTIGSMLREDMPDNDPPPAQSLGNGTALFNPYKNAVLASRWIFSTDANVTSIESSTLADYMDIRQEEMWAGSFNPMEVRIDVGDRVLQKQYDVYNFATDSERLTVDIRQNLPLQVSKRTVDQVVISAPWPITGVEYVEGDATVMSCSVTSCHLRTEAEALTIIAQNEYGGTAIGSMEPDDGVDSTVFYPGQLDMLRYSLLTLAFIVGIVVVTRYAVRLVIR